MAARYRLTGRHTVGFEVAAYDHRKPLVIDPVLSYSTYLGGNGGDGGRSIVVDGAGNAYVTGSTGSANFPITPGAFQTVKGTGYSNTDAFIAKVAAMPNINAGLAVTMTGPAGPLVAGNNFSYTLTVTNNGPERASSIIVNDDLPPATIFYSRGSTSATCSHAGNSVSFSLGSLDVGATTTMTIYAYVSCSIDANVNITNTATVTASGTDSLPDNNTAMASTSATNPGMSLTPTSRSHTASGGSNSVSINSGGYCSWTATSNANWTTITYSSGSGSGFVNYSVAANSNAARQGTMTIAGQTFTVLQAGACTAAPTTTSANVGASAGTSSVTVAGTSGCSWEAASNTSWLHITSGSSGSGNGTVNYSFDTNPGSAPRTGVMVIAGQTFTVTQNGFPVRANFDGDLGSETGYYRNGLWGFLQSSQRYDSSSPLFFSWGGTGLQPIIGDFDGDGRADPGVWRSSQGIWIIPKSSSNYASYIFSQWGQAGDVALPNNPNQQ